MASHFLSYRCICINTGMNFLQNKYTKCYLDIIRTRTALKRRRLKRDHPQYVYYEMHHIIPRSLGGDNRVDNLVLLTPKEHFICHLLLTKMVPEEHRLKMVYALNITLGTNFPKATSSLYTSIRKAVADGVSHHMKGKKKSKDHIAKIQAARVGFKHTTETKQTMSESRRGRTMSVEERQKRSNALKGRKQTPEHLAKLSAARKGRTPWNKGLRQAGIKMHLEI